MDEYVDIICERARTKSYSNMYGIWAIRDYTILTWYHGFRKEML